MNERTIYEKTRFRFAPGDSCGLLVEHVTHHRFGLEEKLLLVDSQLERGRKK